MPVVKRKGPLPDNHPLKRYLKGGLIICVPKRAKPSSENSPPEPSISQIDKDIAEEIARHRQETHGSPSIPAKKGSNGNVEMPEFVEGGEALPAIADKDKPSPSKPGVESAATEPTPAERKAVRVPPCDVLVQYLTAATTDSSRPPRCVILCGPTATGKTRRRREKYSSGYALVDAAAIFVSLAPDEVLDFPEALRPELEVTGQAIATAAVRMRVDIVTEVIGVSLDAMTGLIDSLRSIGYTVDLDYVHADVNQAWQWNVGRSENNISAYYAEEFNFRWLVRAVQVATQAACADGAQS